MSRFINRKVNKTPVRSPSPDIANSNIITRTASPINEAISSMRISKSSKNPLGRGFMNTDDYEIHIKDLEEKIQLLMNENEYLKNQATRLSKQLYSLKQANLNKRHEIYRKTEPQLHYQPDLISEYSNRIGQLSKEVKRIHDLLLSEREKNEGLVKQNGQLRIIVNSPVKSGKSGDLKLRKELVDIEYSLNESFDKQLSEYEHRIEYELAQKLKRMGKIQRDQAALLKLMDNKRNFASPVVANKSPNDYSTSYRTPTQQANKFSPGEASKYDRLRESRQIECQKCKIYLRRIAELEAQINIDNIRRDASKYMKVKVSSSKSKDYLQKLEEIKALLNNSEIEESINHIEQNLNDIFRIDEKFEYMKEEKNKVIQELRESETQRLLQIASLKKEKEILKVQVLEQQEEIQKLRELLKNAMKTPKKEPSPSPRKKATNDSHTLRKYIQEAISRIENLQDQIGSSLKQ